MDIKVLPSLQPHSRRRRYNYHSYAIGAILSLIAIFHLYSNRSTSPPHRFAYDPHDNGREDSVVSGRIWNETRVPRVAIIGAGAAGSSAAYFLNHLARGDDDHERLSTEVVIYEMGDYVGGRSTVIWPWQDDSYHHREDPYSDDSIEESPIELGASIFVSANRNLQKAAKVFNLTMDRYAGGEEGGVGIWDGEEFVVRESEKGLGWWDSAKLLWRYGRSPFTVRSLVKKTVDAFLSIYSSEFVSLGGFSSLSNLSHTIGLSYPASLYASDYFAREGVSALFSNEVIAAGTQVNYGTPIDRIHGLGALVSLAATGAVSIEGGNRQLFEGFVGYSQASLRLETKVTEISKLDSETSGEGERARWVVKTESGQGGGTFDAIILAAPFHQTGIEIHNSFVGSLIPPQSYVSLHVTIVLTNATTPLTSYFSHSSSSTNPMPNSIFSTFNTKSRIKPSFNSLNYLKRLPDSIGSKFGQGPVHVVKLFSSTTLPRNELQEIFGEKEVLKLVEEKVWKSYPNLEPIDEFLTKQELSEVRLDEGFYYTSGFERLISTMETQTVSSFNAVSLLMKDFFNYVPRTSWADWEEDEK